MKEVETYISYIKAVRNDDKLLRQGTLVVLENSGFNPDPNALERLIATSDKVKNELFNQPITVVLKVDSISGHDYIKRLPIYDEDEKIFLVKKKGFYPKGKFGILYGDGELKDEPESEEDRKQEEGHVNKSLRKKMQITQEQWEKLGYWAANIKSDPDLKYSLLADLTTSQKVYHFNRCNLEHHDSDPNVCYKFTEQQIELLEQQLQAGDKTFVKNAIQSLFDKAKELADQDIAELPPPSPRMVNAAFAGFKLAYDLQNNFNAAIGVPVKDVPEDEELYSQASSLIARSHNLMDCAFAMGRRYNIMREQQDKQSSSNSSPKPNL